MSELWFFWFLWLMEWIKLDRTCRGEDARHRVSTGLIVTEWGWLTWHWGIKLYIYFSTIPIELLNLYTIFRIDTYFMEIGTCIKILATELLSILENANHFLPKSFRDAPRWYTSVLSIIKKRSWLLSKDLISIWSYCSLAFFTSNVNWFEMVLVN